MQKMLFSAPGNLMLIGEYAVLNGKDAIVIAINKRLMITIEQHFQDCGIIIDSDRYGVHKLSSALPNELELISFIFRYYNFNLDSKLKIIIRSEFSDKVGFGSSSALISCLVSFIYLANKKNDIFLSDKQFILSDEERKNIFLKALEVTKKYFGIASGSDLTASIFGGIILYNEKKGKIIEVNANLPILAVYSGIKKKTYEVVNLVEQKREKQPLLFEEIFNEADSYVRRAYFALEDGNIQALGKIMKKYHELLELLGVNSSALQDIYERLIKFPSILGAKISGSGLGDCVIAVGSLLIEQKYLLEHYPIYNISVEKQGLFIKNINDENQS